MFGPIGGAFTSDGSELANELGGIDRGPPALNGGKGGMFLGMDGLNNLEPGESGGGGTLMLPIMRDKKAAFADEVCGISGSYIGRPGFGKYGDRLYGLREFARNAELK